MYIVKKILDEQVYDEPAAYILGFTNTPSTFVAELLDSAEGHHDFPFSNSIEVTTPKRGLPYRITFRPVQEQSCFIKITGDLVYTL